MGWTESGVLLLCAGGTLLLVPGVLLLYGRPGTSPARAAVAGVAWIALLWIVVGDALAFGRPSPLGALFDTIRGIPGSTVDPTAVLLHVALPLTAGPLLVLGARWRGRAAVLAVVVWTILVLLPVSRWMLDVEWGADGLAGGGLLVAGVQGMLGVPALDFAGGTVVHVAAGAAVLGALIVARRAGAVPHMRRVRTGARRVLGAVLLWGASVLLAVAMEGALDDLVPTIVVGAVVAPAAALAGWLLVEVVRDGAPTLGGAVSGLVTGIAVAASGSAYLETPGMIAAGLTGGAVAAMTSSPFRRAGVGGPHDLVAVHLIGGAWGVLALGVGALNTGLVYSGLIGQFVAQAIAIAVVGGYACGVALLLALLLRGRSGPASGHLAAGESHRRRRRGRFGMRPAGRSSVGS